MATLAFWHPFGPHGREKPEDIIDRKRNEIANNGWTLWSFQHRTEKSIESWMQAIHEENPEHVLVLCSVGKYTQDSEADPEPAQSYREYHCPSRQFGEYIPIPSKIKVPHPWGDHQTATAFKVSQILLPTSDIIAPCPFNGLNVQPLVWQPICKYLLWKDGGWENRELPTRPEYLLKLDNNKAGNDDCKLRPIRALLELESPYVVEIRRDEDN